jgi:hypothetical protein
MTHYRFSLLLVSLGLFGIIANGAARQTNVVNSGWLTAVILASDIADPGTAKISVHSPNTFVSGNLTPCGGDSNSLAFSINP